MNPTTYQVPVDDTGAQIIEDATSPAANEDGRITYIVQNLGPNPVYIGDAEVSAPTGFEIAAGGALTIAIRLRADLFGITNEGETADIRVAQIP